MNTRTLIEKYFLEIWGSEYCQDIGEYEIQGSLLRANCEDIWGKYTWREVDLLDYITWVFNQNNVSK